MPGRIPPVQSPITAAALLRGLRSLPGGGAAKQAEKDVGAWLAATFAPRRWHLVDSGTSALRLALQHAVAASGKRRIALPAYGCYDLATACDGAEVEVVLYDIDPATLGPEWSSYQAALATNPVAVVLVHLYGVPVDLDRALALASASGVRVIEDAAQGAGGSWAGKPLGSFGDYAVLSFGRGKGVTGGGGGALLLHSAQALDPAFPPPGEGSGGAMRLVMALAQCELSRPWIYWLPASLPFLGLGETPYHPPHAVSAMTAASFGLLAGNLAASLREAEIRRVTAARFTALLGAASQGVIPTVDGQGVAGYLRYPVITPSAEAATRLVREGGAFGIAPGYPLSLADLPGFTRASAVPGDELGGARMLAQRLVTLPTHGAVDAAARQRIVRLLGAAGLGGGGGNTL